MFVRPIPESAEVQYEWLQEVEPAEIAVQGYPFLQNLGDPDKETTAQNVTRVTAMLARNMTVKAWANGVKMLMPDLPEA